jgi:hypothetical protein
MVTTKGNPRPEYSWLDAWRDQRYFARQAALEAARRPDPERSDEQRPWLRDQRDSRVIKPVWKVAPTPPAPVRQPEPQPEPEPLEGEAESMTAEEQEAQERRDRRNLRLAQQRARRYTERLLRGERPRGPKPRLAVTSRRGK